MIPCFPPTVEDLDRLAWQRYEARRALSRASPWRTACFDAVDLPPAPKPKPLPVVMPLPEGQRADWYSPPMHAWPVGTGYAGYAEESWKGSVR